MFKTENRPDELWVAYGTRAYTENQYLKETWPASTRFNNFIAFPEKEDDNILQPKYLQKMQEIHDYLMGIQTSVPLSKDDVKKDCDPAWEEKFGKVNGAAYCKEYRGICGAEGCDAEKYTGNWSFMGKQPESDTSNRSGLGIAGEGARCFERGPFCWRSSILDVFVYNIDKTLVKGQVDQALEYYPKMEQFCPFSLFAEKSPCILPECQAYDDVACTSETCTKNEDVVAARTTKQACRLYAGQRSSSPPFGYPTGTYCDEFDDPGCDMTATFGGGGPACPADGDDDDAPAGAFAFEPTALKQFIGGIGETDGKVTSGTHFVGTYVLKDVPSNIKGRSVDPVGALWEKDALYYLLDPEKTSPLKVVARFERSFGDELSPGITSDLYKFIGACVVISLYLIVVLGKRDSVHSMMGMSGAAILSVILAIMAGWGLCFYFGVYFSSLTYNIPFLLLGLGVDDAFVIVSEYHRAIKFNPKGTIEEILTATAEHAGLSIFITSLTDGLAFLIGATTVIPALRNFCIQAGVCVIMIFIFQITFVMACLAYDHKRSSAKRYDCCCCFKSKAEDVDMHKPRGCCFCCNCKPELLARFFRDVFGKTMLSFYGKIGTAVLFFGVLIGGIYGAANLYKDFKLEWFLDDAGSVNQLLKIQGEKFSSGEQFFVYTRGDVDYYAKQDKAEELYFALKGSDLIDEGSDVTDWHHRFLIDSQDDNDCKGSMSASSGKDKPGLFTDKPKYWSCMKDWLEGGAGTRYTANVQFQSEPCNSRIEVDDPGQDGCKTPEMAKCTTAAAGWKADDRSSHTVGNCSAGFTAGPTTLEMCAMRATCNNFKTGCKPEEGIKAARTSARLSLKKTETGIMRYNTMQALRELVSEHELGDAFPFTFQFMWWEEMGVIDIELSRNVGLCVAIIFVVVMLLIPRPRISIWVFLAIAMSIVDVLGYCYFWDITINGVVTVYLLISLGLAVDYSVHIGHMFKASTGSSDERALAAMHRIAPSVFNAIFSTFLAVIVLAFSTTYIFRAFFKVFFLVTLLAGLHGIWFLPVVLSVFGGDNGDSVPVPETAIEMQAPDPEKGDGESKPKDAKNEVEVEEE